MINTLRIVPLTTLAAFLIFFAALPITGCNEPAPSPPEVPRDFSVDPDPDVCPGCFGDGDAGDDRPIKFPIPEDVLFNAAEMTSLYETNAITADELEDELAALIPELAVEVQDDAATLLPDIVELIKAAPQPAAEIDYLREQVYSKRIRSLK